MSFVEYVNLIWEAKKENRIKILFDNYPRLKIEYQECAFFLFLILQNNSDFMDECIDAAANKDAKRILDLAFDAERANVPVTWFIFLFQILSKNIDNSFGVPFYCSFCNDTLLEKYQKQYGKNFGLGTKIYGMKTGPSFLFGNMAVLNSDGAFPWTNVQLSKTKISEVFVGPRASGISAMCFSDMPSLKSVFLSSEVTHLDKGSFSNCPNLEKVFVGPNITNIGDNAFSGNTNLEFVGQPFEKVSALGKGCFAFCSKITELLFGENVKKFQRVHLKACLL